MLVTTVQTSLYLYFQALCQVLASDCKKVQKLWHVVQKLIKFAWRKISSKITRSYFWSEYFWKYALYNLLSGVCFDFFDLSWRSALKKLFTTCWSVFYRFCGVLRFHRFANLKLAFLFSKTFWKSWETVDNRENIYLQWRKYILLWVLTTLISLWWVSYEGSFQVCDGRWWKKIKECQALKLGDAPMHPKKYLRRFKRLILGMPPCIPFSIYNHQFVHLHAIFLSLHMLCAMLGASRYLLFSLF